MEANLEHTKSDLETELYVKLAIERDHRRILAMFRLAICHYILKLGVLLDLNSPWNRELVFTA